MERVKILGKMIRKEDLEDYTRELYIRRQKDRRIKIKMKRLTIRELELDTLQRYRDAYRCPETEFVRGLLIAYRAVLQNLGWTWKSLLSMEQVNNGIKRLREE